MASTPQLDTRSPLTLLNIVPKEHEKAIKLAFYNTAANLFVLLACVAVTAVYFILEAFLRPLLWAVLCGAFLNPFKRTLTGVLRNWLNGLHRSETPFIVGLIVTPIKCADSTIDLVFRTVVQHIKLLFGVCIGIPSVYVIWHFGPLWGILAAIRSILSFTYDLLGYFSSFWVWTLAIAYLLIIIFYWNDESRDILRYLSVPVWVIMILHVAGGAGVLRVPLLIFMGIGVTIGFIAETNELRRQQTEGRDPNRKSVFEAAMATLMGDPSTPSPADQSEASMEPGPAPQVDVETIGTTPRHPAQSPHPTKEVDKPSSLSMQPGVVRRHHLLKANRVSPLSGESPRPTKALSDQYFIALFWGLLLTRLWIHIWLITVLLPIPIAIWIIKTLGYKLSSPEGPLGDRVKIVRRALGTWIKDRKDVLMPKWLRGVARLVMKGDQKVIGILDSSLDRITSILFILLLLIGSALFTVFFAIQVQQESMYLVKTTSSLLNNTLHPEMANWLPNNEDVQQAMDSMVGNAYHYGRGWIASKVRDMVNGPQDNNTQIETQVLDMWDRLYESWLARNASSTSLTETGPGQLMPFDITNFTSVWSVIKHGDGFNFSDVIGFVKENIGTFLSVLESIWLVLKGNMSLVLSVFTSTLSLVFGGGTALLNFVISSAIFLTTLFYLLASSGDTYKPIEWFANIAPSGAGNTFGQAVQDAVGGVFMASLKMASFYGLYTWLTHTLFGVNIVFIPSALAAIFAAVPFLGTYLAAIPAVLELWLVQDRFFLAILLLVCHFLPTYIVDTAIYSEIKGGHPFMTGLAIAGGMYWIGLEGAIFGPIILCCLVVLMNVYSSMMQPDSPAFLRSQSIL